MYKDNHNQEEIPSFWTAYEMFYPTFEYKHPSKKNPKQILKLATKQE